MPELPEVEVLVRYLGPLLKGKTIRGVAVHRPKVIRPDTVRGLGRKLLGARFASVKRRAKFLVFELKRPALPRRKPVRPDRNPFFLLGHLGMTGRMYLQPVKAPLPRHAAVSLDLGRVRFVYEDTRYFGRLTTDFSSFAGLGPEPLTDDFAVAEFARALKRSRQAIKVRLLDQTLVAGIGNIYASEALFRAGIPPGKPACRLTRMQIIALHREIREVLRDAIDAGSTIPLDFAGTGRRDGQFYYGRAEGTSSF
jgi:formamidopyrimidine-DNA glycosylase